MTARRACPLWVLLVLAAGLSACAPGVPVREPAAEIPSRIQGILEPAGIDLSLEGAEVRAGDYTVRVGPTGSFFIPDSPQGRKWVVAEKRFGSGVVRRAMGMTPVFVGDYPFRFKVLVRDATDIDRFCEECHPYRGKKTRKEQVVRCVHQSGLVPKKAEGGKELLDAGGRVTCESCHTVHASTGFPKYLIAPIQKGVLCRRCHV